MTAGAGRVSLAVWEASRGGAETGGGTTAVVEAAGPRMGGGSRCTSGDG